MRHMCLLLLVLILAVPDIVNSCEYSTWNPLITKNAHFAVLILARGGSKGIKLKNLSKVGKNSLLVISLQAVKELQGIDSVWVSTDHSDIAREAQNENVNIHWRSPESATDTASSLEGLTEFLKHHPEIDVLGLVQCTSPFIKSAFLQQAVHHMRDGKECSFAVSRSYKLRWRKSQNKLIPLNFDPARRPRRQDFDGELTENGMFYFSTRKLIRQGVLQSNKRPKYVIAANQYLYRVGPDHYIKNIFTFVIRTTTSLSIEFIFEKISKFVSFLMKTTPLPSQNDCIKDWAYNLGKFADSRDLLNFNEN